MKFERTGPGTWTITLEPSYVKLISREELKQLYPEPKRKRPRFGKRRVR